MGYLTKAKELENYGIGVSPDHKSLCSVCNTNDSQVFFNEHPLFRINQVFPCKECFKKQNEVSGRTSAWYEKNPTSIFKNEVGHEIAVDQRGKPMNNPWEDRNRKMDNHGWLKTNKREFKRHLEKKGIA